MYFLEPSKIPLPFSDLLVFGLGGQSSGNKEISLKGVDCPVNQFKLKKPFISNGLVAYKSIFSARAGQIIGEAALERAEVRAASCFASEDTVGLVLDKVSFDTFFSKLQKETYFNRDFLTDYFPRIPNSKITNLSYLFQRIDFERRNIIISETLPVDGLYIIHSGQIELFCRCSKLQKSSQSIMRKGGLTNCGIQTKKKQLKQEDFLKILRKKHKKKTKLDLKKLGIISNLGIFGLEALFTKNEVSSPSSWKYSAKVVSEGAIIFKLKTKNIRRCLALLGEAKTDFIGTCRQRYAWLVRRLKESVAPQSIIPKNRQLQDNGRLEVQVEVSRSLKKIIERDQISTKSKIDEKRVQIINNLGEFNSSEFHSQYQQK